MGDDRVEKAAGEGRAHALVGLALRYGLDPVEVARAAGTNTLGRFLEDQGVELRRAAGAGPTREQLELLRKRSTP